MNLALINELKNSLGELGLLPRRRSFLDVSSSLLVVLETVQKKPIEIKELHVSRLPKGTILVGEIKKPQELTSAAENATQSWSKPLPPASIAAPGTLVITKEIGIDPSLSLTASQMEAYVWATAEKVFPGLSKEIYLDYVQTSEGDVKIGRRKNILLIAARKKMLDTQMNALNAAGLKVDVVDIDYYALSRAYHLVKHQLPEGHEEKYIGLLNIDYDTLILSVIHKDEMIYSHRQILQNPLLEELLGKTLEKYFANDSPETTFDEAQHTFFEHMSHLLQLCYTETKIQQIDHLLISGPCALIPNIDKHIEKHFFIKTQFADPLATLQAPVNIKEIMTRYSAVSMICAGLMKREQDI